MGDPIFIIKNTKKSPKVRTPGDLVIYSQPTGGSLLIPECLSALLAEPFAAVASHAQETDAQKHKG